MQIITTWKNQTFTIEYLEGFMKGHWGSAKREDLIGIIPKFEVEIEEE